MSRSTQELRILEEDMGAGAITFENYEEGVTYLFVRPKQSFEYAVKSVHKVCPHLSLSRVQELVRTHCKTIVEMNERLGADLVVPRFEAAPDAGVVPPVPMNATGQHRRPRPPRWAKVAAVAAPALAGGMLLAQWLNPSPRNTSSTSPAPSISQDDKVAAGTYRNPAFKKIAAGGAMKCDPMGAYEAKCVDADGMVMYSEASVGTSTAFTFSYGLEKIGFRLFPDAESASAWAAEEANRDLYQNVMQYGRVVLWGTDAERLREWGHSLTEREREEKDRARAASGAGPALAPMMAASAPITPLPDRLAFLAFGTLGVTEETIQRAVRSDDIQSVQLLRAVELVLGSADGSQLGIVPSGPADAVAIVADATTPPGGDKTVPSGALPVPVKPLPKPVATPTPGPSAETQEPTTTPTGTSSAAPKPAAEPEPEPEPEPAAEQPAAEPEPDPAPAEEPQEQPADPEPEPEPAAEQPAAEPEPDPAPAEEPQEQPAEPEPKPEPKPEPEPELEPEPAEDSQPVTPPAAEDVPQAETPPAPPVTEEPEDDGLALDAMPTQWAA